MEEHRESQKISEYKKGNEKQKLTREDIHNFIKNFIIDYSCLASTRYITEYLKERRYPNLEKKIKKCRDEIERRNKFYEGCLSDIEKCFSDIKNINIFKNIINQYDSGLSEKEKLSISDRLLMRLFDKFRKLWEGKEDLKTSINDKKEQYDSGLLEKFKKPWNSEEDLIKFIETSDPKYLGFLETFKKLLVEKKEDFANFIKTSKPKCLKEQSFSYLLAKFNEKLDALKERLRKRLEDKWEIERVRKDFMEYFNKKYENENCTEKLCQDKEMLRKILENEEYCEYLLEYMQENSVDTSTFLNLFEYSMNIEGKNYIPTIIKKKRLALLHTDQRMLLLDPSSEKNAEHILKFLKEHNERQFLKEQDGKRCFDKYGDNHIIKEAIVDVMGAELNGGVFYYYFLIKKIVEEQKHGALHLVLPNVNRVQKSREGENLIDVHKELDKNKISKTLLNFGITKQNIENNFIFYKPILESFFQVVDEENLRIDENKKKTERLEGFLRIDEKGQKIEKQMFGNSWGLLPLAKSVKYVVQELKSDLDKVTFNNPSHRIGALIGGQTVKDVEKELDGISEDAARIKHIFIGRNRDMGKFEKIIMHDESSFDDLCQFFKDKKNNNCPYYKYTKIEAFDGGRHEEMIELTGNEGQNNEIGKVEDAAEKEKKKELFDQRLKKIKNFRTNNKNNTNLIIQGYQTGEVDVSDCCRLCCCKF